VAGRGSCRRERPGGTAVAARTVCAEQFARSNLDLSQRRRCRVLTVRAARRDAQILIARVVGGAALAAR